MIGRLVLVGGRLTDRCETSDILSRLYGAGSRMSERHQSAEWMR